MLLDVDPDVELAALPQLSTIVFRPAGLDEDAADRLLPRVRSDLYERGEALVAATRVDGRRWLKLTLLNPMAHATDVLQIVRGVLDMSVEVA